MVKKAVTALVDKFTHNDDTVIGALFEDVVISEIQAHCPTLLRSAIAVVHEYFGQTSDIGRPQLSRVAPLNSFLSQLPSSQTRVADVTGQLNRIGILVHDADVDVLVTNLCSDLDGSRQVYPTADFRAVAPGADLRALPAVDQITALVLRTCPQVSNFEVDTLLQTLIGYLIANEPQMVRSFSAPLIYGPTWNWSSTPGEIRISWGTPNPDEIQDYELWVSTDNAASWRSLIITASTSYFVQVTAMSNDIVFALRAKDNAGQLGGWLYLRPCLVDCT